LKIFTNLFFIYIASKLYQIDNTSSSHFYKRQMINKSWCIWSLLWTKYINF